MKRSKMIRSVTACTFVVASTMFTNLLMAQEGDPPTDVRYRIHWIEGPAGVNDEGVVFETTQLVPLDLVVTTDVNGYPVNALVVGAYYRSDRPSVSGFVYDVFGTIDPDLAYADPDPDNPTAPIPYRFWDVEELVGTGPPAGAPDPDREDWSTVVSSFRGVNSAGLISGYVENLNDPNERAIEQPVYLNLDLGNPDAAEYELVMIPRPDGDIHDCRGKDVTEFGDILVPCYTVVPGELRGYVYDAYDINAAPEYIASETGPIVFSSNKMYLNSSRQVVGTRADGMVIRHSMLAGETGETEEFPGLHSRGEINDVGQFAATATNIRGAHRYATRVGIDGSYEWTAAEKGTWGARINLQGDLLFYDDWSLTGVYYYHDWKGESFNLKDLVIAGSDPDFWFRDQDAGYGNGFVSISDRDFTEFGWVAKALRVTNPVDESFTWHLALLIPESPQPTPGITVTPTSPLVTTEDQDGEPATFEVVLDTKPTADVTIDIRSSNIYEGTVDPASLTFTADDWSTPQTVTATGVEDDGDMDRDVDYDIDVIPSSIGDEDYDILEPIIVEVTNLDNDSPLGGSETYFSNDTPVNIPDYPRDGVASHILVEVGDGDIITNLTVNVDITHPRESDLFVILIDPDGNQFLLSDDLPAVAGLWTLEVSDSVKKEKGKLNSWSITIDY